jgi:hypothetical protein
VALSGIFAHGLEVIVIAEAQAPAGEARTGLAPRKSLISFNCLWQTEASNVSLGMRMIPVSNSNLSLGENQVGIFPVKTISASPRGQQPRLSPSNMEYFLDYPMNTPL